MIHTLFLAFRTSGLVGDCKQHRNEPSSPCFERSWMHFFSRRSSMNLACLGTSGLPLSERIFDGRSRMVGELDFTT